MGLADRVVAAAEVFGAACALAATLAAGPPESTALAKRAVDEGFDLTLERGLDLEQELFRASFGTRDAGTGVASFLESGPGKARFR